MLLMLSFASDTGELSIYPFIGAAILRDVLLISLVVLVVRDVLRPRATSSGWRVTTTRRAACRERPGPLHGAVTPADVRHWRGRRADGAPQRRNRPERPSHSGLSVRTTIGCLFRPDTVAAVSARGAFVSPGVRSGVRRPDAAP